MKRAEKIEGIFQKLLAGSAPHTLLPSEREIATRHGVNRDTVRRALGKLENQGLVYRLPSKGTFVSPVARGNTLLVVVDETATEATIQTLLPPLLMALFREFREADPSLSISICPREMFVREVSSIRRHYPNVCGIFIFMVGFLLDRYREPLLASGLPILYCGYDTVVHRDYYSAVFFNESDLCRRALDLLEAGACEEFAVWGIQKWLHAQERARRFDQIVQKRGHRLKPLPQPEAPSTRILPPEHPLIPILRYQKRRLGIFTVSDADSVRLVLAAQMAGCPIPDRLQITGVEGSHLGALSPVPVSHFSIPLSEAGALCAHTMLDLLGGGASRQVDLDIPLTIRSSTLGAEKGIP